MPHFDPPTMPCRYHLRSGAPKPRKNIQAKPFVVHTGQIGHSVAAFKTRVSTIELTVNRGEIKCGVEVKQIATKMPGGAHFHFIVDLTPM